MSSNAPSLGSSFFDSEILVPPSILLAMPDPVADCTGHSMVVASLLLALGIPCELVTVSTDGEHPGEFNHVYVEAILEDGTRTAVDTSGPYPGWSPEPIYRRKRWGITWPEQCAILHFALSPCVKCGSEIKGGVHVTNEDGGIYCSRHCPRCSWKRKVLRNLRRLEAGVSRPNPNVQQFTQDSELHNPGVSVDSERGKL